MLDSPCQCGSGCHDHGVLTRRGFLVAGGASVGVLAAGVGIGAVALDRAGLSERELLDRALGRDGSLEMATFPSTYRRTEVSWGVAVPPDTDAAGLPMVLALHGRGGDARSVLSHSLRAALADHVEAGGQPFTIVAVDGGDHSYWHPRADGTDALRMITAELLPRAADHGLRVDRIATLGWSMGGFGSLMLARESAQGRLEGTRVVAAAASGAALWPSAGLTAPGAFDSAEDFERWGDLIDRPGVGDAVALRVDCGDSDPFAASNRAYRSAVRSRPEGGMAEGGHDSAFWDSVLPAQLAFLGAALSP
jgi:S-formylglutathione hydrolase FrmB